MTMFGKNKDDEERRRREQFNYVDQAIAMRMDSLKKSVMEHAERMQARNDAAMASAMEVLRKVAAVPESRFNVMDARLSRLAKAIKDAEEAAAISTGALRSELVGKITGTMRDMEKTKVLAEGTSKAQQAQVAKHITLEKNVWDIAERLEDLEDTAQRKREKKKTPIVTCADCGHSFPSDACVPRCSKCKGRRMKEDGTRKDDSTARNPKGE